MQLRRQGRHQPETPRDRVEQDPCGPVWDTEQEGRESCLYQDAGASPVALAVKNGLPMQEM